MRSRNLASSITVGVIGLYFVSTVAQAQQASPPITAAPPAAENDLNEVIVTARRVEERLQTVPISIAVYDQQQLTDRGVYTAADLATFTPSLSANSEFGGDNTAFGIRGFQQALNTAPTVASYFDDVVALHGGAVLFSGNGASVGSFFDLQNVQILKGPQGTLFGRNTTGGAILLVPKKPTPEFEGYLEVSAGNYGMERVQGALNVPLTENLRLRVGLDQQTRDGYLNNVTGIGPKDFGDVDYVAGRVSLVADITDNLENYTVFSINNSDTNGNIAQAFYCNPKFKGLPTGALTCAQIVRQSAGGPYGVANNVADASSDQRTWQVINTTTWDASDDLTIKNIASYGELRDDLNSSLFGIDWLLGKAHLPFSNVFTPLEGGDDAGLYTLTDELQVQGRSFDEKLRWQGGVYMEDSHSLADNGNSSATYLACSNPQAFQCTDAFGALVSPPGHPITVGTLQNTAGELTYRDYGIYGQATYQLSDEFKLTEGLRYTYDSSISNLDRVSYTFPTPNVPVLNCVIRGVDSLAAGCPEWTRTSSHAPTWLIDLDYTPTENILVYVKYARGYRAGGLIPSGAPGFQTYRPEKLDSYEVGTKTSFHWPVSGTFDAAAFDSEFSDQQIPGSLTGNPGVAPVSAVFNAGTSRLWGFELESSIKPIEDVTLDIGYTYLNTTILSLTAPVVDPHGLYNTVVLSAQQGSPMPLTPKSKLTVSGSYRLPLDPELGPITVGADFVWIGKQLLASGVPFGSLPGYGLMNLNVNWENVVGKPVDVEFFMNNVLDRFYPTYFTDFTAQAGLATRTLGQPRMFGGRVRVHF